MRLSSPHGDHLVHAADAVGSTAARAVLQDLAGALQVEGAFVALAWDDARLAAAAIAYDALTDDNPVDSLRIRANKATAEAGTEASGNKSKETQTAPIELDPADVNDIIDALDAAECPQFVVLEDFHYLPEETQRDFAVALKASTKTRITASSWSASGAIRTGSFSRTAI